MREPKSERGSWPNRVIPASAQTKATEETNLGEDDQATTNASRILFGTSFAILKQTAQEWLDDKAPQLGAALAYYTVFSLAPLVLVLLAIIGILFREDPAGVWSKVTEQMSYFLDKSAVQVVTDIAQKAAEPDKSTSAAVIAIALALFGASGVFGQLQDSLNTIWGVKAKPGREIGASFARALSRLQWWEESVFCF